MEDILIEIVVVKVLVESNSAAWLHGWIHCFLPWLTLPEVIRKFAKLCFRSTIAFGSLANVASNSGIGREWPLATESTEMSHVAEDIG
ncbi:hypothetical protein DXG01_015927, partial [Tephrocybe rancida]